MTAITSPRVPSWLWQLWPERRKKLRRDAWILLVLLYAALLFAYLLPPDFRNTSPVYVCFAWAAQIIRTLQFHAGLFAFLIALAALAGRNGRIPLAAAPLLIFTLGPSLLLYLPRNSPSVSAKPLRVFSANLLMINRNTGGILAEIDAAKPDVLLLQEYTAHWQTALDAHFGADYPHRIRIPQEDSFGIAVYSRLPFVGKPVDNLRLGDWPLPQLRAVVNFEGREVALYNIHLVPPRNLQYVTQHRLEFADLLELVAGEKIPVIMTGDFNCTEATPQAFALRRAGFSDVHDLVGFGRGSTWPVNSFLRYLPGLRLDHIYVSSELTATTCRAGTGEGSDHRPVIADITFK